MFQVSQVIILKHYPQSRSLYFLYIFLAFHSKEKLVVVFWPKLLRPLQFLIFYYIFPVHKFFIKSIAEWKKGQTCTLDEHFTFLEEFTFTNFKFTVPVQIVLFLQHLKQQKCYTEFYENLSIYTASNALNMYMYQLNTIFILKRFWFWKIISLNSIRC